MSDPCSLSVPPGSRQFPATALGAGGCLLPFAHGLYGLRPQNPGRAGRTWMTHRRVNGGGGRMRNSSPIRSISSSLSVCSLARSAGMRTACELPFFKCAGGAGHLKCPQRMGDVCAFRILREKRTHGFTSVFRRPSPRPVMDPNSIDYLT